MGATPANVEVYARLAESAAAGDFDLDSSADSLSLSGRYDSLSSSLKNQNPQQQQRDQPGQQVQQQGEVKSTGGGLVAGSSAGFAPIWEVQQQQQLQQAQEEVPTQQPPRPRGMPVPLRRREGMSDVWQHQGAFRSNRRSMKSMFEEVRDKD